MHENKDVLHSFIFRGCLLLLRPLAWYALFTFVVFEYIVYGEYEFRLTNPLAYVAAALVLFLPFMLGWIKAAYRTRAFSGKITAITVEKTLKTSKTITRSRLKDDHHDWLMTFFVENEKGKKFRFEVIDPDFKDAKYYKIGDLVRHFWGAKHIEKSIKTGDRDVLCLVCGELCRVEQHLCYNCRHSLVKRSGLYVSK